MGNVLRVPREQTEGGQAEVGNVLRVPLEQALGRQKESHKSTAQSLDKQKHPAKSSVFLGNHQLQNKFLLIVCTHYLTIHFIIH